MNAEELKKLEEEVAALEQAAAKKTGKPIGPAAAKQATRTRKAAARARNQSSSNAKQDMPPRGGVEWEAWQASKLQQSGAQGKTLLMMLKETLDKQMRRLEKLHIGDSSSYVAQGRAEGLACAIGMLRGTSMSVELRNSKSRIGGDDSG